MLLIGEKKEKHVMKLNGFSDNSRRHVMKLDVMNGWKNVTDSMCCRVSDEGEIGSRWSLLSA